MKKERIFKILARIEKRWRKKKMNKIMAGFYFELIKKDGPQKFLNKYTNDIIEGYINDVLTEINKVKDETSTH